MVVIKSWEQKRQKSFLGRITSNLDPLFGKHLNSLKHLLSQTEKYSEYYIFQKFPENLVKSVKGAAELFEHQKKAFSEYMRNKQNLKRYNSDGKEE